MDMLITNFTKSQHRQTFTGKNIAVRLNEQMNFACLKLKCGHKQILVWSMEKKLATLYFQSHYHTCIKSSNTNQ